MKQQWEAAYAHPAAYEPAASTELQELHLVPIYGDSGSGSVRAMALPAGCVLTLGRSRSNSQQLKDLQVYSRATRMLPICYPYAAHMLPIYYPYAAHMLHVCCVCSPFMSMCCSCAACVLLCAGLQCVEGAGGWLTVRSRR